MQKMNETKCHCGQPLHYIHKDIEDALNRDIAAHGDYINVTSRSTGKTYKVQRHYLALHGLKEQELPFLGFEEVSE